MYLLYKENTCYDNVKKGNTSVEVNYAETDLRYNNFIHSFNLYSTISKTLFSTTGGDDNKLVIYDMRQDQRVTCKSHDAGVTSLKCSKNANTLASGSYDEVLRLWDKRNWKYALEEIKLGGGVWRIKWNPNSQYILAACMHAGFKLINFSTSATGSSMSTEFTYSKHDSLAYGCDWCLSDMLHDTIGRNRKLKDTKGLIATCSFYDSKLSLWLLCS
ncbi:hypothetical protein J437_LFUL015590 [Ladona fulva]|uniref:methylated diphthine methylhydrolase n=1 Tax=Ladona fulva TaxID=123851 RepID=A0A8K0P3G9_LADFU|nr:hypothetical protein J437_LFUL015590 [Ladona fulva]